MFVNRKTEWEIRKPFGSLAETISWHVANPHGLLYNEPERLFSDEIRTSVQAYTMLSLICCLHLYRPHGKNCAGELCHF